MPASERSQTRSKGRGLRLLGELGRDLRQARIARGLSQATVASSIGISQAQLSLIEHARYPAARLETLSFIAGAVGLELSVRVFPAGQPIRDRAHVELLERFRNAIGPAWTWAAEVPLPIPGDKRAWDRLLRGAGIVIGVEAETRPTDLQELQRRLGLKKRDGGVDRLALVLADTSWCRRLVRLNDIDTAFPVTGNVALKLQADGRDPGGDALILV